MLTKRKFLPIYLVLFALLVSVAIGSVAVSAQGPSTINTSTPTKTATTTKTLVPGAAVTNTLTPTVPTATKTTAPVTATSAASTATRTRTSTTVPVTKTATVTATKPSIVATVTRTPTKAVTATVTRTPTKPVLAPRSVKGSTTKSLSTSIVAVNLGGVDANVSASYLKPDGSAWPADAGNTSFTLSGNYGNKIITLSTDGTMTTGQGSAVISSDQPVGGMVEILAPNQTATSGAYTSVTPANQFYIPQVLVRRNTVSGIANTQIVIQSTESSGSITATVTFNPYPGSGFSSFIKTGITLQPGASLLYDVADESSVNLPDGWYGSAVVTAQSGKLISVVVNIYAGPNQLQTFSGFPASSAGPNWSVPQFVSRIPNGLSTGVVIQNLSGAEIPVNGISMNCKSPYVWSVPSTFVITNTVAVPNSANFVFNPVTDMSIPGNWSGACRLTTTDKNVVAFVQMRFPGVNDNFCAYEAFRSDSTNTKAVFPLVSKRQSNGFATVATIQNLDLVNSADVKLTYYPSAQYVASGGSATPLVYLRTIAADSSLQHNHRLGDLGDGIANMPDGWYGTLLVEPQNSGTARPIVGYAQLTNYLNPAGDTYMAASAFSLP